MNPITTRLNVDNLLLQALREDISDEDVTTNSVMRTYKRGEAQLICKEDGVIAGMSIKPERQEKFDFSDPYFDSGVVMGVKEDNEDIKSYEDLAGKKVAVKIGTEGQTFAESIKDEYGFTTVVFDDSTSMYLDVKSGNSVVCD